MVGLVQGQVGNFLTPASSVAKRRQRLWLTISLLINDERWLQINCKRHIMKLLFRLGKEPCNKRDNVYERRQSLSKISLFSPIMAFYTLSLTYLVKAQLCFVEQKK